MSTPAALPPNELRPGQTAYAARKDPSQNKLACTHFHTPLAHQPSTRVSLVLGAWLVRDTPAGLAAVAEGSRARSHYGGAAKPHAHGTAARGRKQTASPCSR
jgi:hypothetical protein